MRKKTIPNIAKRYVFVTVICFSPFIMDCLASDGKEEFQPVDSNRIPEVLNMISNKVLSNYDKIKTWQGKAEGIMTYGKYRTVEFDLDVEKDFLYVKDSLAELINDANVEGGKTIIPKKGQGSQISIASLDYYIHSQPDVIHDDVVISRKAFKKPLRKGCPTCQPSLPFVFDPRSQLNQPLVIVKRSFPLIIKKTRGLGENKTDGFVRTVEERTKNGVTEYRVAESGKISPEPNSPNRLFMSSIFSSDKGFNITSQETTLHTPNETRITQRRTWDYGLVDGVYVLSKTMTKSYSIKTGESVFYEEIAFKDVNVNQPISSDVFSYKNLGLKNGDKFIDKIAGKEYKYQDENLVFVADVNK